MKKLGLTLLISAAFGLAQAQLKDVMLKKAGEKINKNKAEKNASSNETKEANTSTEQKTESTTPENNSNQEASPFSFGGKKEVRPKYTFHQNALMDMKSYDKKGNLKEKESSQMRWHFSTEPYNGMEVKDKDGKASFSVFDGEKSQMVMMMDNEGNKMAIVSKIDQEKLNKQIAEENEKSKVVTTKTGRTKKILGYTCEEWTSTDEKGTKTEMWISSEVPLSLTGAYSMFGPNNKDMAKHFGNTANQPKGFMMEMISIESNGEKFTMTAIEVNLNAPKTIETTGYTVY